MGKKSELYSSAMKMPTFLWVGPRAEQWSQLKHFSEEFGFELIHCESFEELSHALALPHLFLTFIDTTFMLRAGSFLKTHAKSLVFHVALSDKDGVGSVSRFYEQGFSDVLMKPTPFAIIKSRIFLFLERWLQKKLFPAGTYISPKLLSYVKKDFGRIVYVGSAFNPNEYISAETFDEAKISASQKEIILGAAAKWNKDADAYFKKVAEPDSRILLIKEMEQRARVVTIWTRGQRNIMKVEVSSFNDLGRLVSFYYPSEYSSRILFAKFLSSQVEEVLYCNFDIGEGRFFFGIRPSEILFRDNRFEFFIPEDVFRVQRRGELRLSVGSGVDYQCNLIVGQNEIRASMFDVSASGMKLQTDLELMRELRGYSKYFEIKLDLKNVAIEAAIQKKWVSDHSLGFEFVGLSSKEREKLRLFVFENMFDDLVMQKSLLAG